ncbi:MAG: protein kinase [bacterium]|nr:protein kinase [bacterium]
MMSIRSARGAMKVGAQSMQVRSGKGGGVKKGESKMGGHELINWSMQCRQMQLMTHKEVIAWLRSHKFDEKVIHSFERSGITGKALWNNIRNASMFLYNVGVVRPTFRDAIVQHIYADLLPKTPGFAERKLSDFKNISMIGSGPISTVYRAQFRKGVSLRLRESLVAIKCYHFSLSSPALIRFIHILTHLVQAIKDCHFMKIYGYLSKVDSQEINCRCHQFASTGISDLFTSGRPMFAVILEYGEQSSMRQILNEGKDYSLIDKVGILLELSDGLNALHNEIGMAHKNLKASNIIMCGDDGDAKLADYCMDITQIVDVEKDQSLTGPGVFNTASHLKETDSFTERSVRWMAPELLLATGACEYTFKTDSYAFGITMFEIFSGNYPYEDFDTSQLDVLLSKIIHENLRPDASTLFDAYHTPEESHGYARSSFLSAASHTHTKHLSVASSLTDESAELNGVLEDLKRLMEACWHKSPDFRPSMDQIVERLDDMQDILRGTQLAFQMPGNVKDFKDPKDRLSTVSNATRISLKPPTHSRHNSDTGTSSHDIDVNGMDLPLRKSIVARFGNKSEFKPRKRRPRRPLPKAPPRKRLPSLNVARVSFNQLRSFQQRKSFLDTYGNPKLPNVDEFRKKENEKEKESGKTKATKEPTKPLPPRPTQE